MEDTTKMALAAAVAGGYVLGRTKKARLAFTVATYLAGRRFGLDPKQLMTQGLSKLQDLPQFADLSDQLRGDALDAGRKALSAAADRKLADFADSLHERTLALSSGDEDEGRDEEEEEEGYEDEDEELAGRDEEPEEEDEEPPEEEPEEEDEEEDEKPRTRRTRASSRAGKAPQGRGRSAAPARKTSDRKAAPRKETEKRPAKSKAPAKKTASAKKSAPARKSSRSGPTKKTAARKPSTRR